MVLKHSRHAIESTFTEVSRCFRDASKEVRDVEVAGSNPVIPTSYREGLTTIVVSPFFVSQSETDTFLTRCGVCIGFESLILKQRRAYRLGFKFTEMENAPMATIVRDAHADQFSDSTGVNNKPQLHRASAAEPLRRLSFVSLGTSRRQTV